MGVQLSSSAAPAELRPVTRTRRFATARAVSALILREMATTYGRSPGGYIWAILEPAGGIFLLVLIFSAGFRNPALGTNFAIFFATGIVPFMAYMSVSSKLMGALIFSRQLIAYPSVTLVDSLAARLLLDVITQLLVAYCIFSAILLVSETQTALHLPGIALAFFMAFSLGCGVGVMNCYLTTLSPVWRQVWGILNRPLFIISCIFFLFEAIPEPYRSYLWYNPLVHVVGQMRKSFYPYYDAPYVSLVYVFGLSLILLVIGLIFLLRYHRDLMNN